MRKEMLEMQKKIDELNEIKESGLLGGQNSTFISQTAESFEKSKSKSKHNIY